MITQTITQTAYVQFMMSDGTHNAGDMLVYVIGIGMVFFIFSYNFWKWAQG